MATNKSTQSGFTVVELLIVVVIIAILAAITIVAYNGIQVRAKNASAQGTLNTLTKKIHTYYVVAGAYPSNTGSVIADMSVYKESNVSSSGIAIGTPSPTNGMNTLKVELCTSGGVKITPYDFIAGALSTTVTSIGNVSTGCSTATA